MGIVSNFTHFLRTNEKAKEFILYVVFLIVFSIVGFAAKPGPVQFDLFELAQNNFGDAADAGSVPDMKDFLEGDFADQVFPMYNELSGTPLGEIPRLFINGQGRFMGAYRLRLLRAIDEECATVKWLMDVGDKELTCLADYSSGNKAIDDIGPRTEAGNMPVGGNFTKPFIFQHTEDINTTNALIEFGEYAAYNQDGYVLDIIPNLAPNILADKLQDCRPLLQESVTACMAEQGVEYDVPEVPPPAPPPLPPPNPTQLGDADSAGMVLTAASYNYTDFTTDVELTVTLSEDVEEQVIVFKLHNPSPSGISLDWQISDESISAMQAAQATWLTSIPQALSGQIDSAYNTIQDDQYNTPGQILSVTVGLGAEWISIERTAEEQVVEPTPASLVFEFLSASNPELRASVTLNVRYVVPAVVGGRRRILDAGARRARAGVTSHVGRLEAFRKLLQDETPAAPLICEEHEEIFDGPIIIPSELNVAECKMLRDEKDECDFPYIGFQQMLELLGPDRCGECKCKEATDEVCMESCSARGIFEEQMSMLQQNGWFDDRNTRAYMVDLTVFHQSSNLFQTVRIMFEAPGLGGIWTQVKVRTFRLYRYVTTADTIVLGFELILVAMVVWYTVEEMMEIRKQKWEYFNNPWNWVDWINLIVFYIAIGLRVVVLLYVSGFEFDSLSTEYLDFPFIAFASSQELNAAAFNFFIMYCKVFKYLQYVPRMDSIILTVSGCMFDIALFMIMFMTVMFGFSAAFYVIFGPEVPEFKSLGDSFGALMRSLLGDFDYGALSDANSALAPILFYFFNALVFMVLLNMFLAIICDSFAEVKGNQSEEDLLFYSKLKDQIVQQLGQMLNRRKRIQDLAADISAADTDMDQLIDESELAAALKDNPRAYEILQAEGAKELLKKYDVSGDGVLDKAEMTQILKDLASKEMEVQAEIDAATEKKDEVLGDLADAASGARAHGGGTVVANFDTTELEGRIDKVEGQIKELSRNVAKKLSLMIDLLMSLSDQISNTGSAQIVPTR
mmetsp:Transcript_18147/g.59274  ORF Transcript_18147/g.59274 Transcript_18147/m.59274 type:complete len:1019 (-) Transcript_18147:50-3106(-)